MNPENDNKEFEFDELDLELPKTKDEIVEEESNPTIEIDNIDTEEPESSFEDYSSLDTVNQVEDNSEIVIEEEPKEEVKVETPEVKEEKPMKHKEKGRVGLILRKIVNIIIWLAILGILAVWIIDFIMVKQEKDPKFCIETNTYKYPDGTIDECIGLGYKIYNYQRTSFTAVEFGPIFIEMRE